MREVCDHAIEKQCGDVKADTTIVIGEPQHVKLPFACEERTVHWDCPLFENNDEEHINDTCATARFNGLSCDLVDAAKKKKKKKKKGCTRAFGSPVQSPGPTNRAARKGTCATNVDGENMEEC